MDLANTLRCLANGMHPETGRVVPKSSLLHKPATLRMLYQLIDELSPHTPTKAQKSVDQRRLDNFSSSNPINTHPPWSDCLFDQLAIEYEQGTSIARLARSFGRSQLAIAIQLEKLDMVTQEEVNTYRTLATA